MVADHASGLSGRLRNVRFCVVSIVRRAALCNGFWTRVARRYEKPHLVCRCELVHIVYAVRTSTYPA
eukprot:6792358-Prymnesium_polylepis.1